MSDVPANRILKQHIGKLYGVDHEVIITEYGDGSRTVAWRPDPWSTWRPYTDLRDT